MSWTENKIANKTEEGQEPARRRKLKSVISLPLLLNGLAMPKTLLFRVVKLYELECNWKQWCITQGLIFRECVHECLLKRKGIQNWSLLWELYSLWLAANARAGRTCLSKQLSHLHEEKLASFPRLHCRPLCDLLLWGHTHLHFPPRQSRKATPHYLWGIFRVLIKILLMGWGQELSGHLYGEWLGLDLI